MNETIPNLEDLASRLYGCIELLSLLSISAKKTMISSGVMCCICDLLNGIYSDLQSEISSAGSWL